MDDATLWAKLRDDPHLSWHIVDSGEERVLCGRVLEGEPETADHLPLHEKSCELCLRLHEHGEELVTAAVYAETAHATLPGVVLTGS